MSFGFGNDFRITVFGESHGKCVGVVVEGCPAGLLISEEELQQELDKRKPGTGLSSARQETDAAIIMSGIMDRKTNGGPIAIMVMNKDADPSWYGRNRAIPRPGHADYTAYVKYAGFNDWRGGGFFSGRMTAAIVMAGAIAKTLLRNKGIKVMAHLVQLGKVQAKEELTDEQIEVAAPKSLVWCASAEESSLMIGELEKARAESDSLGGIVECRVLGLPVGIGEPIFNSVESIISHGIFSIPAVKGIEFGSGFRLAGMRGSEANDEFALECRKIVTKTNRCGGILGGITDGMPVILRVAFKPTPSIGKGQRSVDMMELQEAQIRVDGRHDPCIAVRAVPVVEAMVASCLADLMIRAQKIARIDGEGKREDNCKGMSKAEDKREYKGEAESRKSSKNDGDNLEPRRK